MAVTHTGGGDLSIIERLLLARDRREVVLSPELMEAELLMLSWLDGPRLTNDYEMELLLGDDGIVTLVPIRIGKRAVQEPVILRVTVLGVHSEEAYSASITSHMVVGGRNRWSVKAYTDKTSVDLGTFEQPIKLRRHLLEPQFLKADVLEHIQYLIEEPRGEVVPWL